MMLFFSHVCIWLCVGASETVAAFVISLLILFTTCFKMRSLEALALFQLRFFCFWFCCCICICRYSSLSLFSFPFYPIKMSLYLSPILRCCAALVLPRISLRIASPRSVSLSLSSFWHVCWRVSNGIACLLITNIPWFRFWFDLFSQNIHSISFLTPWTETLINFELINFVTFVQLPLDYVRVKQSLLHLCAPSAYPSVCTPFAYAIARDFTLQYHVHLPSFPSSRSSAILFLALILAACPVNFCFSHFNCK